MPRKKLKQSFLRNYIFMDEENKDIKPEESLEKKPTEEKAVKIKGKKKKTKAKLTKGKIYINSTYNNTIVSVTDLAGNVLVWGSAGKIGFKGSKKSTPYAGQKTMEDVLARSKERGLNEVDVFIKGIGSGRESAVRAIQGSGLNVLTIKDQTPIPHGGVRPKKPRRV
jgi:small subunit ribosomal protein S11